MNRAWWLVLILLLHCPHALAQSEATVLDCASEPRSLAIPATGEIEVTSSADRNAWFGIEEKGHLLRVTTPGRHVRVPVPYRYGFDTAELAPSQTLRIARALTSNQSVMADITIDCSTDATSRARRAWIDDAGAAVPVDAITDASQANEWLARVDRLIDSAATPRDGATAVHLKAQVALKTGRTADIAAAFADARTRWHSLGDEGRARAAQVGRVEELQRLARHDEALRIADAVSPRLAQSDYFAARLRLSRCLTLRYLGKMQPALACFREGVANMERLGEQLDLVSALQDMADVEVYLGNATSARALGEKALALCTLPAMELHRGRIELTFADISLDAGDLPQALQHFDAALGEFAAAKAMRWEANAMLRAADLYIAIGALDEAADFVALALSRLNVRDAPARVAAARVVQARIDAHRGQLAQARATLADAAQTYRDLKMSADLDVASVTQARVALQDGDTAEATRLFDMRDTEQTINRDLWTTVRAMIEAATGRCAEAGQTLRTLAGRPLPLPYALDRAESGARCLAAAGDHAGAQRYLWRNAENIVALAQQVDNPLLRKVLLRNIAPLRRTAFRLAFADRAPAADAQILWRWLRMDDDVAGEQGMSANTTEASTFDAAVARELLRPRDAKTKRTFDAPRHLLDILAGTTDQRRNARASAKPPAAATPEQAVSIASVQQRLPAGAAYLSYVDAGTQARLLWITRDEARLLPTLAPRVLSAATDSLVGLLSSQATSPADIDAEAARLSNELLPRDLLPAEPAILLIDSASPLATLPWPALRWPRATLPLVETTRVSLVRFGEAPPVPTQTPTEVAVFVAAQEQGATLPALPNARFESEFVAEGLKPGGGRVTQFAATSRASLIQAFMHPRPWLHIAAHGGAEPSRVGYSGLWLDADTSRQAPRFVSWLDVLSRGAANELVVLNACRLAQQTTGPAIGLSFADAISRAGVRDVIAGRWQLSDSATTQWVPEFYRRLSQHESPASALWSAQRRLRESRTFRHPFYWAAYVHLGRI